MNETVTAPAPDTTTRDKARLVIDSGYHYLDANLEYMSTLKRFARANNIAENSAEYRALDTYFRSVSDTEITPLPDALQSFEAMNNFDQVRTAARTLTTKRNEFSAALTNQGGAYATNAAAIIRNLDSVAAANQDDDPHLILNTAINNSVGANSAQGLRTTGWPEGVDQSFSAGRDLVGKLRALRNGAGGLWESITGGISNMFGGGNGEGQGGGFSIGGILGALGGGVGGFMIGRMFGGGIFGTIASVLLGVFGAYLGASTFGGRSNSNNAAASGTPGAAGTPGAPGATAGSPPANGERNIPIPDNNGGIAYINAAEFNARLGTDNLSSNVRYNPSRDNDYGSAPVFGVRRGHFNPAQAY